MTDYSITISNRIDVFDPDNISLWNAFDWGTGYWLHAPETDYQKDFTKVLDDSVSVAGATNRTPSKVTSESVALTTDVTELLLIDAAGYKYYILGEDDLNDRHISSYTAGTSTDPGYTEQPPSSPIWSDA